MNLQLILALVTVFLVASVILKKTPVKYHRRIGIVLFTINAVFIGYAVASQTVEWRVKNVPILSTQHEKDTVRDVDEIRTLADEIIRKYK